MKKIMDGVFLFENGLSQEEQKELLKISVEAEQDFYVPRLKSGHYMNLDMTCFGKHWSAVDYKYHDKRVDFDSETVSEMPAALNRIASRFSKLCFPEHEMFWDIALLNSYVQASTLGMHQDNSESKSTLESDHPVVSFSLGASCTFRMGGKVRKDPYVDFDLHNGSVLIFGGPARLNYHGVVKILDVESPFKNELNGRRVIIYSTGQLNLFPDHIYLANLVREISQVMRIK